MRGIKYLRVRERFNQFPFIGRFCLCRGNHRTKTISGKINQHQHFFPKPFSNFARYFTYKFLSFSKGNFTDIFETLSGVVDGLLESDYSDGFVVLIRRGGPRWQEAFKMIEDRLSGERFKFKLFGPDFPIVETAVELASMFES